MGIVVKKGLVSTFISYIGVIIGAFNVLYLLPKYLDPEQIGITRLIVDLAMLLVVFFQFGLPNVSDKFFPKFYSNNYRPKGFYGILFISAFFFSIVYSITLFSFKTPLETILNIKDSNFNDFFLWLIPLGILMIFYNLFESINRAYFQVATNNLVREIILRLFLTLSVICYALDLFYFEVIVYSIILSYAIASIILLSNLLINKKLRFEVIDLNLYKPHFTSMSTYAFFIFLGSAGTILSSKIDTVMLGSLSGLKDTGIYSIAFFIGTIIEIPRRSISQISTPIISRAFNNNDLIKINKMYFQSSINQLIIGGILFLLIWLNVDDLFLLIPNSEIYIQGKYVVLIIGLTRIVDMSTGINTEIILNSKYYKFNLFLILILGIATIIFNLYLIPIYGIIGAALSTLFSIIIYNLVKYLFILIKYKMQPFNIKTVVCLAILFLVYFIINSFPWLHLNLISEILVQIIFKSTLIITISICLIYFLKISEELNSIISHSLTKLKTFL